MKTPESVPGIPLLARCHESAQTEGDDHPVPRVD